MDKQKFVFLFIELSRETERPLYHKKLYYASFSSNMINKDR